MRTSCCLGLPSSNELSHSEFGLGASRTLMFSPPMALEMSALAHGS
jgi:hypothetical protein